MGFLLEGVRPDSGTAAVGGVQFDSAVMAKALGRDAADVEEQLQELETRHGFVRAFRRNFYTDI